MKKFRLLGIVLLVCLVFTMFVACDNGDDNDISVTGVTLDKSTASIEVDKTVQLTATVAPANATNKSVTWSSDKDNIATVSSAGLVTGKATGTAVITVKTADGNKTATCTVTVTAAAATVSVTGVTVDKSTAGIFVDGSVQLTATVAPANATNKGVTWSSDKENIATVSSAGLVTGKAAGTAVITVKTADGNKTATCTVTVKAVPTVAEVKAAFETAGYTVIDQTIAGSSSLVASKGTDALTAMFFANESTANLVMPTYVETAGTYGYTCKQAGRIIYYGTTAAMAIFDAI